MSTLTQKQLAIIKKLILMEPVMLFKSKHYLKISKINVLFSFGIGINYKFNENLELYLNTSQNYRSVTFADISIFNPAYSINPNIKDENGITSDIGFRGTFGEYLSLDFSLFNLRYNDRIGFTQKAYKDGSVKSERGNVGDAEIIGFESILEFNLDRLIFDKLNHFDISLFCNLSSIKSEYVKSETPVY